MNTWVLTLAAILAVVLVMLWIEPGIGIFVAFVSLPYLIAHLFIREEYIHSVRRCICDYHAFRRARHDF